MLKKLSITALLLLVIAAGFLFYGYSQIEKYSQSTLLIKEKTLFKLPFGTGRIALENKLVAEGVIPKSWAFAMLLKLKPELSHFKAGTYRLEPAMTIEQMLTHFASGQEAQFTLQFIEGTKAVDWLEKLAITEGIKQTLEGKTQKEIADLLGIKDPVHLEGWFYPDTYLYTDGTKDIDLLTRAYKRMKLVLDEQWAMRAKGLPYENAYEMLIMASIIEKETGIDSERTKVASVFINRLKLKMKLQTDPTIIYGLGDDYKGTILRSHLRQATEYNTYIIDGLPPTPIAMPSLRSLQAAANPDKTDYLYFVATGNGGHQFSRTLREHNRAVSEFRKTLAKQREQ